ncbi:hypothetical protein N7471_001355 [Penicillium samsonianum]|uniref:uncharacterized protein n=1 Tax=Penicillium samsonianum TaxID=1882272 RepID=UPI0025492733|nr:uncharacterized protein N7471_001355 [Penicillium samsonianum]KAJ6150156.1 hypothetical protein N7471_001355 [Penicillium samsonianum]
MMVVKDTPERVVWINFDQAKKYDEGQLTAKQKDLIEQEEEVVVDFTICLTADHEKGKADESRIFFYA